ncbi:Glycosyl transferases group 1 [uncultured archaeon]|nr:Glycosyl transferases group 1 [uncultured archaeon]
MALNNLKDKTVLAILGVGSYTENTVSLLINNYSRVVIVRILNTTEGKVTCRIYEHQNLIWSYYVPFRFPKNYFITFITLPLTLIIQYISIIFVSILALNKIKGRYSICIAEFYTGFFCGYFLKNLTLVDKLVYWAIDWFPTKSRKETTLMSFIAIHVHPYLDLFCAKKANTVWNFSKRIISARHSRWSNETLKNINEEIVTPPLRIRNVYKNFISNKKSIGFIGILKNEQGLKLAIETILFLKQKGINLILEIVGSGDRSYLEKQVNRLKIEENVIFHGFVKEDRELETIFSKCICGIALFDYNDKNYSCYTWPSKVGFYLECGIPVVATKCISFADEFEEKGLGFIVDPVVENVMNAIIKLLNSDFNNDRLINYVLSKSGEDIITRIDSILTTGD